MRLTNGLFHRPADSVIVREVKATYSDVPVKRGDVVLDLGANIGAASRLLLDKGAGKVIVVEPDPTSLILAQRNLRKRPAVIIHAAVGEKPGRVKIHIRPGRPHLTSTISDAGRHAVVVPMVTLGALLEQYRPAIVKCDIEFGEYDLPELGYLPDFVRVLTMEVHIRYDLVFANRTQTEDELRAQRQKAADLIASVEAQGFRRLRWSEKAAKTGPIKDETGLKPLTKSVDAIWSR